MLVNRQLKQELLPIHSAFSFALRRWGSKINLILSLFSTTAKSLKGSHLLIRGMIVKEDKQITVII